VTNSRQQGGQWDVSGKGAVGNLEPVGLDPNHELVRMWWTFRYHSQPLGFSDLANPPLLLGIVGLVIFPTSGPAPDPGSPSGFDWLYWNTIDGMARLVPFPVPTGDAAHSQYQLVVEVDHQLVNGIRHGSPNVDSVWPVWHFFWTPAASDVFGWSFEWEITDE